MHILMFSEWKALLVVMHIQPMISDYKSCTACAFLCDGRLARKELPTTLHRWSFYRGSQSLFQVLHYIISVRVDNLIRSLHFKTREAFRWSVPALHTQSVYFLTMETRLLTKRCYLLCPNIRFGRAQSIAFNLNAIHAPRRPHYTSVA